MVFLWGNNTPGVSYVIGDFTLKWHPILVKSSYDVDQQKRDIMWLSGTMWLFKLILFWSLASTNWD